MKCFSCGKNKETIKHHTSYEPEEVVDCCRSCHAIIHARIPFCDRGKYFHMPNIDQREHYSKYGVWRPKRAVVVNREIRETVRTRRIL